MTTQEQQLLDSQENKRYYLSIPFKSPLRKTAKEMGARWDANNKVWTIVCKMIELEWEGLDCKIVELKSNAIADDTFGTGCTTTAAKAARYGYDAIER